MFKVPPVGLLLACVLSAFKHCNATESDGTVLSSSKPDIDGILDMTMLNFDYYNSFEPSVESYYVLVNHKLDAVDPIPESLAVVVARGARRVLEPSNPPILLDSEPNYQFVEKCFKAHPKHFSYTDTSNRLRCHFIFGSGIDPSRNLQAFRCHLEQFKVILEAMVNDSGWLLYLHLLLNKVADKEYCDVIRAKSSCLNNLDVVMNMNLEERWSHFLTIHSGHDSSPEIVKTFDYLVDNFRKELLGYLEKYGSCKLKLWLCRRYSYKAMLIMPTDFVTCSSLAASNPASHQSDTITNVTQSPSSNSQPV
jgi:hypothetical protein